MHLVAFTPPALSTAEARNQHRDMLRRLGAARDTLWIAEIMDSMARRNRRAIWGVGDERPRRGRCHQPGQRAAGRARVQGVGEGVTGSPQHRKLSALAHLHSPRVAMPQKSFVTQLASLVP